MQSGGGVRSAADGPGARPTASGPSAALLTPPPADRRRRIRRPERGASMSHAGRTIDLNADLGEGCPWDEAMLARVTSTCVCCGAHASDSETILRTLRAAKARGVVVGAHPGYADREGFGRREQSLSSAEVERLVRDQ